MLTWSAFEDECPTLAAAGRRLLYEHGIGLGFLATVRPDAGPRVHPICPVFAGDGLYALIVPGPKLGDLRRDGRYALHSETCPPPRQDDAFYVTGTAREQNDRRLWQDVATRMLEERNLSEPWPGFDAQVLFELAVDTCLVTMTSPGHGLPGGHTVWRAGR